MADAAGPAELPYCGDMQAAMRAQDRDAIRILMAARQPVVQAAASGRARSRSPLGHPAPVPPTVFAKVVSDSELWAHMQTVDLEVVCSADAMQPIDADDLFNYAAIGPYASLHTVVTGGCGSGFHCWGDPSHVDILPVVMLGSEGERAKVGRTPAEFIEIALSLVPFFRDAVCNLPGLNTLPDNGDIEGASGGGVDWTRVRLFFEQEADEDRVAQVAAADSILAALGLRRRTVDEALSMLLVAHLDRPRFAIISEDDL